MAPHLGPNAQRYLTETLTAIEADLGAHLPVGTSLVPADDRLASGIATCYPFGDRTAVWCDPDVAALLGSIVGPVPVAARDFVDAGVELGAAIRGIGVNRVLDGPPEDPRVDIGSATIRSLDRENAADAALIAALRAAVSGADAEEAGFRLASIDPQLVAAVEPTDDLTEGRVLSLAMSRVADAIPFDDIGVITHPDARRRGLGVACVHRLIELRAASGNPAMYRCGATNTGSNRIALRLGFELVQTIGSIRFGD